MMKFMKYIYILIFNEIHLKSTLQNKMLCQQRIINEKEALYFAKKKMWTR